MIGTPQPADAVVQLVLVEKCLNASSGVVADHRTEDSCTGKLPQKPCRIGQQVDRVPSWMKRLLTRIDMIKHLFSKQQ